MNAVGNALTILEVDLGGGVRAGFTTRHGGVSGAPWDSLDLGLGTGDMVDDVLVNRGVVASWLGGPLRFGRQVHGTRVEMIGAGTPATEPECDAMVTRDRIGLGVIVADCVPVLLADPGARVVGVAHAGRRGLAEGVVENAVAALVEAGARAQDVRAAVGPCVCGGCYEVPATMRDEVAAVVPSTWSQTSWGTPALDLRAGVAAALVRAGVRDVQHVRACTRTDPRFFSHRRASEAGETTGRFAGVIALVPEHGPVAPSL